MKLTELVESLTELVKGGHGDLDVICSKDDEGNGFNEITFSPTLGSYDKEDSEFYPEKVIDTVCIN